MRRVDGVERHVQKEGLPSAFLLNELNGFGGQQMRAVAFVVTRAVVAVPIVAAIAVVFEVIQRAVVMSVQMIDAASGRLLRVPADVAAPFLPAG